MERLLTVPEVAEELQVKPSTIYTWVRQDRIPHIRVGRLIRFTIDQIDKFLNPDDHSKSPDAERQEHKDEQQEEKDE